MGGSPPMYSNMGTAFRVSIFALGVTRFARPAVWRRISIWKSELIDAGKMIGPKMHITARIWKGVGAFTR